MSGESDSPGRPAGGGEPTPARRLLDRLRRDPRRRLRALMLAEVVGERRPWKSS